MASTNGGTAAPNIVRRNIACSSCSVGMASSLRLTEVPRGRLGFAQQDGQGRDMRIPLNQRRNRSKAPQRVDVEGPDCLSNRGTMIVDQYSLATRVVLSMSSQMDLRHMVRRERLEIGDRVAPEIRAAHINIVDITQQPAVCPAYQLTQKFRLRNRRMEKAEITRRVLNEQTALEHLLRVCHMTD